MTIDEINAAKDEICRKYDTCLFEIFADCTHDHKGCPKYIEEKEEKKVEAGQNDEH